jgi:Flp pilus assembly pilin Flp
MATPDAFRPRRAAVCPLIVSRFLVSDSGQDIVEYALLAAFIGVAGVLVLNTMGVTIFNTYQSWIDPSVGAPSIWDPAAPLTSGGGS